jgi:hypothetical protein
MLKERGQRRKIYSGPGQPCHHDSSIRPGRKEQNHRRNIGLAGNDLEYSITSSQKNDLAGHLAGHFLIALKSPNAENDLREQDRIMAGATLATNQLLISGEMSPALNQSLEILGCLANVDRAYIYEHRLEAGGEHQIRLRYEWTHETVPPPMRPTGLGSIPYSSLSGWFETLSGGMPMRGSTP